MYFIKMLKKKLYNKGTKIFVDMDGVIADYEFGKPLKFKNKRPIKTNIKLFKKIAKMDNIELNILSVCQKVSEIKEKEEWLDQYASFFKAENRFILAKEVSSFSKAKEIKCDFFKKLLELNQHVLIILIDDDNNILKYLKEELDEQVILFQDSSLVD